MLLPLKVCCYTNNHHIWYIIPYLAKSQGWRIKHKPLDMCYVYQQILSTIIMMIGHNDYSRYIKWKTRHYHI